MFLVRLLETPSILFQGFFQVLFLFVEYLLSLLTRLILLRLAFGLIILEIDFLLDLFPLFKSPRWHILAHQVREQIWIIFLILRRLLLILEALVFLDVMMLQFLLLLYLVLGWIVVGLLVCGRDQPGLRGVGRLRPFGVIEYLVVVLRLLKILIRVPAFYKVSRALLLIILGSLIVFINLVLLSSLGLVVRFVRGMGIIPLVFLSVERVVKTTLRIVGGRFLDVGKSWLFYLRFSFSFRRIWVVRLLAVKFLSFTLLVEAPVAVPTPTISVVSPAGAVVPSFPSVLHIWVEPLVWTSRRVIQIVFVLDRASVPRFPVRVIPSILQVVPASVSAPFVWVSSRSLVSAMAVFLLSRVHAPVQRIIPSVHNLRGGFLVHFYVHIHILHSVLPKSRNWLHVIEVGRVWKIVAYFLKLTPAFLLGEESLCPGGHDIGSLQSFEFMDVFASIVVL